MKKVIKRILLILLAVIVIVTVGGSVWMGKYVAERILYQNENNDTVGNSLKQMDKWGYDYQSFLDQNQGEDFEITVADGTVVPGTIYTVAADAAHADTWVILVHGAGGDRMANIPLAEQYLARGYNVLTYDWRGHGKNSDPKVTFGIRESGDIAELVRYTRETLHADKVIVHGQSMGGQGTAIYASNVTPGTPEAADAVICENPVPGFELFMREMFGDGPEGMNSPMSVYLVGVSKPWLKYVCHVDMDDGDTIQVVATDQLPTLIIIADKDEVCLPEQVQQIYDNVGTNEKAVMHVNSGHIEGVIDDPDGFMEGVTNFLATYGLY